eukprot:CAMPEP_0204897278 /NCGR_PEP_ID=MMETSP1397-20131031/642_1 /ASSEMBLY_ACC=CAM_ASM_000891 /TAXON_ID=49980 /ORGANISM="Climacostomum Climacostomum virens, Strain Stock W-24" /LENGTH=164 /DNA_ID=CAMNT_0052065005 /DNA_START=333 /DNA_END=824 /DNA_ORIENTATION=-
MLAVLLLALASGFEVEIGARSTQCYGDDFIANKAVEVRVGLVRQSPGNSPLNFRVTNAVSKVPIVERLNISNEKIAFVTNSNGPLNFCVDNLNSEKETVFLKILTGVAAHDFSELPTSKEVQKSTNMVHSIEKKLVEITESLRAMRSRDEEFRRTSETIYSRVW